MRIILIIWLDASIKAPNIIWEELASPIHLQIHMQLEVVPFPYIN